PVLFRAVVAPRKRNDHRVTALDLAEPADRAGVVGQGVVGKDAAGGDVGTHGMSASRVARPPRHSCRVRWKDLTPPAKQIGRPTPTAGAQCCVWPAVTAGAEGDRAPMTGRTAEPL